MQHGREMQNKIKVLTIKFLQDTRRYCFPLSIGVLTSKVYNEQEMVASCKCLQSLYRKRSDTMRIFEVEMDGGLYFLSSCRPDQKKTTR